MKKNTKTTKKKNKLIYDKEIAAKYHAIYGDPITLGCDLYVGDRICQVISDLKQKFPGQKIRLADIGCGEGFVYKVLQERNIQHVEYTGFDMSSDMLEEAIKNGIPENLLRQGDMHNMSDFFQKESVHLVTATYGTHSYTKNPISVHKESARILTPGGKKITMKYTARLGVKVLTGESTAHHPNSEKFFYSGNLAQEAVEKSGYFLIDDCEGINFFALPIHVMDWAKKENNHELLEKAKKDKKTLLDIHKIIQHPVLENTDVPLNKRLELQQWMLASKIHVAPHETKYRPEAAPVTKEEIHAAYSYIKEEAKIAKFLNYDPGAARYMYLEATRNDKPYKN